MSFQVVENNFKNLQEKEKSSFISYRHIDKKPSIDNNAYFNYDDETSVLDIFPAGVIKLNNQGYVKYANDMAKNLLNEALIDKKWGQIIQLHFYPKMDDGHEVSLKNNRKIRIETRPLQDQSGQLIVLFDLTETRVLQDELANLKKLSEMGRMVSSLAHQIRNPLSTALIVTGRIKKKIGEEADVSEMLIKLESQLHHIENQIKSMLVYSKKEIIIEKKISLKKVVLDACEMMGEKIRKKGGILTKVLSDNNCCIAGNHDVLVGAVVNLIQNSLDASYIMPNIQVGIEENEHEQSIFVSDSGSGFNPNDINKVLDPFYTTKEEGTGLGLSVVNFVAVAHHAQVAISNKPQGGARVTICFGK